jgi:hypothetical protein
MSEKEYKLSTELFGFHEPLKTFNSKLKQKNLIITRFRITYGDLDTVPSSIACIVKQAFPLYDEVNFSYHRFEDSIVKIDDTDGIIIKDNFLNTPINYTRIFNNYIRIDRHTALKNCDF